MFSLNSKLFLAKPRTIFSSLSFKRNERALFQWKVQSSKQSKLSRISHYQTLNIDLWIFHVPDKKYQDSEEINTELTSESSFTKIKNTEEQLTRAEACVYYEKR